MVRAEEKILAEPRLLFLDCIKYYGTKEYIGFEVPIANWWMTMNSPSQWRMADLVT